MSNLASLKSRQNPVQDNRKSKSNIFVRLRLAVLDRVDLNTYTLRKSGLQVTFLGVHKLNCELRATFYCW